MEVDGHFGSGIKRVEWIGAQASWLVSGENENLGEIEGRGGFKGKKSGRKVFYMGSREMSCEGSANGFFEETEGN
jgi:hypothetical protein